MRSAFGCGVCRYVFKNILGSFGVLVSKLGVLRKLLIVDRNGLNVGGRDACTMVPQLKDILREDSLSKKDICLGRKYQEWTWCSLPPRDICIMRTELFDRRGDLIIRGLLYNQKRGLGTFDLVVFALAMCPPSLNYNEIFCTTIFSHITAITAAYIWYMQLLVNCDSCWHCVCVPVRQIYRQVLHQATSLYVQALFTRPKALDWIISVTQG